ncbi:TlpA disulfide reductase family protein [Flavobacterium sp. 5]|uniref:TlpA disulfide reductase family protein n=1 Tax=Flavobacterium sp. 5 TaxID=2035199 RepID=UPI000C2C93D3|nr:TlpA disulfide reductase family protein [Flavobacterium sp. 5]PKB15565.1 thiol-disulfide isomerase/thioredoxin [Flavobacterium sp. 5]
MNKSVMLLFLVCCNVAFSQIGKLYLKDSKIKIGKENTYVYQPPKGVEIPNGAKVRVLYNNDFDFTGATAPLIKKTNGYEFSLKVTDSTKYFVAAIIDGKQVIDNNQNKGYDACLNSSNPNDIAKCAIARIDLINYANNTLTSKLNLKLDSKPESIIAEYNKVYAKYPMMKEDKSYNNYLYIKEPFDKEKTKVEMLSFAQKCAKKNSEDYLLIAARLYGTLKMTDEKKQVEDQITAKYPNGNFESSKFFFDFANNPDKTEAYILERLNLYTTRFSNVLPIYKDYFYQSLLKIYVTNKDFQKMEQYENLLSSKGKAASFYNDYAWNLSGQDLVTPAKDIDTAEKISKRSLDILSDLQKQSDFPEELNETYNMYADTYALVLYKLNRFDEAFQYQDKLYQLGGLDTGGKERYAGMMEKVKGPEITKKYIEEELSKGTNSRVLLAQLETIYGKLNLPLDNFKAIKAKSIETGNANAKADIVKKYGSTDAIKFSLKNLEGKVINLSDLKGKVVVLDFWATWCGPCKASFPAMQDLVTKYKDKNVVFLFVNTWEKGKDNETTEKVATFINDKKYSFNVVFDYDDAITTKYKIEGIPTKILIDKNGSVIAFGTSEQDLTHLIDEQLSL